MLISKKRRGIAATTVGLLAAATVLTVSDVSANVGTSLFEGNDGNTVVNTTGNKDWINAPSLVIGNEEFQGQNDNSFTQGSKEDEINVVIGRGSIPNSKADLGKFGVASETLPNGNVMMYLAWTRNNLSGTVNFDFEINQAAQPDMTFDPGDPDRAIVLNRTGNGDAAGPDDLLINYDLPPGGSPVPVLTFRRWTGTAWGTPTTLNGTNSEGRINSAPVVFDGVTYPAAQFGEAAIDLTAAGIIPNQNNPNAPCVAFGSAYVKSRASSSFTAQMKDYIAPASIGLNTCGTIVIDKVTIPAADPQSFAFTLTGGASALNESFSLTDAATPFSKTNVKEGSGYVAAETTPTGWVLTSATCTNGTPANIVVVKGQTTTCTFTNTKQGTITVDKVTDPAGSSQEFSFTSSYGPPFSLTDAATPNASGFLAPGTYSVAEDGETGWTLTSATCDDGSDPSSIALAAGENVTCTFNNQARGRIIVTKQTDPDGSTQPFEFDTNYKANFFLTDGQSDDSGELAPGSYSVDELTPAGWEESSAVCDDDSTNPATLTLDPGETINCLFTNEQNASITVIKNVLGPNPDNQSFTFTSNFGVPALLAGGQFNSADVGDLDPGTYNVTEDGIANWLLTNADPTAASGAGGNVECTDGSNSAAINLAAGEHVICTFTNERQVGAIRVSKVRKHAADGPGDHPHEGVSFTIHDNVTGADIPVTTGADGTACVNYFAFGQDRYTITEGAHDGYADNDPVTLSVDNVSYCDGSYGGPAEVAEFTNIPLTNVTINVDSQVDGGTKTIVTCNGIPVETNADGDLELPFEDLEPTAPDATLTCTITVDP